MKPFRFSDVAIDFDHHIRQSIPSYDDLFDIVQRLAPAFIRRGTGVYDLGCSTGYLIQSMALANVPAHYVGIDQEFAFADYWPDAPVRFEVADATAIRIKNASLVTCLFLLQFLCPADRSQMIRRIHDGLLPGGAFIIAEKTNFAGGRVQDLANTLYLTGKLKAFTGEEVMDKTASLLPVMSPGTSRENVAMLKAAGFRTIEPIWRNLHFAAWLAIKDLE